MRYPPWIEGNQGNEEQGFEIETATEFNANWEALNVIGTDYKGNEEAAKAIAKIMKATAAKKPKDLSERPILTSDLSALLDCLGELGCKSQAKEIAPILRHPEKLVAAHAAQTAGKLKSAKLIEPLISVLAEGEAKNEEEPWFPEEYAKALGLICGVEEEKAAKMASADWKAWWKENKGTFKEPE